MYLSTIDVLSEMLVNKNIEISSLKEENKKLKRTIESIEQYIAYYEIDCELGNKGGLK